MATATRKRSDYTEADFMRDIVNAYRAEHPGPFTLEAVSRWAITRGLYPIPKQPDQRRTLAARRLAGQTLSTATPAGAAALDPQRPATAREIALAAWRADWLRYLLAGHAAEDFRLALRVLLMGLAYGKAMTQWNATVRLAELLEKDFPPHFERFTDAAVHAITRAKDPVELLMQIGIELLWHNDLPCHALTDAHVESLAEAAGLYLAAHWKAGLGGPLTERFFELLAPDELATYSRTVGLATKDTRGTRADFIAALIAHPETRNHLPACILPVELDPPKKGRKP